MLALKLNVPRNQLYEPSDRTIQSSGWGRENGHLQDKFLELTQLSFSEEDFITAHGK